MTAPYTGATPDPSLDPAAPPVSDARLPAQSPYADQMAVVQARQPATGPIGTVRGTATCVLLCVVTLGIYSAVWYYQAHEEMKRHTGEGLGGGIALVLALFAGFVMPFLSSSEVGAMYARRGQTPPVSGATGLWYLPGILLLGVGPLVWFVKTNNALNEYWASLGVTR
jgi:hypothetical protein